MSNQWRDDTFSMVQLIERGMADGVRYADFVIADNAQNHPILEIDGELYWESTTRMLSLIKFGLFDIHLFKAIAIEYYQSDELKCMARDAGWSLLQYKQVFHNKEEKNDE